MQKWKSCQYFLSLTLLQISMTFFYNPLTEVWCVHTFNLILLVWTKKGNYTFCAGSLSIDTLIFTQKGKTQRGKKLFLWHIFCDGAYRTSKTMLCSGLNMLIVCAYIWWYFNQLRTRDKLIKCVKKSKQWQEFLRHTKTKICWKETWFWHLYWTVMDIIATMMRKNRYSWAFCPF